MKNNKIKNELFKSIKNHIDWNGITLTDTAIKHILQLKQKDSKMLGLKITIKKSGCAGYTYVINKALTSSADDVIYERNGAKLFVPLSIMPFIDGTELDYIQEGLNHIFKFNNPKAQYLCGCGESFGI